MKKTRIARDPKLHHITRMDYSRNRGWWVRIQRTKSGKRTQVSKMFSDGKYAGITVSERKAKALLAAVRWRNKMLPTMPRNPAGRKPSGGRKHSEVGHVHIWTSLYRQLGADGRLHTVPFRCAHFKLDAEKRHAQARFSIKKHGRKGAQRLIDEWVSEKRRELSRRRVKSVGKKRR